MDLAQFVFYDSTGDVYMPDVFLEVAMVFVLAASFGYKAANAIDWLHRNDAPQLVCGAPDAQPFDATAVAELAACAAVCRAPRKARKGPKRRGAAAKGSPHTMRCEPTGASGRVTKGFKKLKLHRIPSDRFNRVAILEMVHVEGAPVVRMCMQGRRHASDVPSAEVTFGSAEDCATVYEVVREPLECDGISVSQV